MRLWVTKGYCGVGLKVSTGRVPRILITALSKGELRGGFEALVEEEGAVSDRRGIFLRGRMDVIRAKLVRRGAAALAPEALVRLARVLLGEGHAS